MHSKSVLIVFFILSSLNLFAQESSLATFNIYGTVNSANGTIEMEMIYDEILYPIGFKNVNVTIENGHFNFIGKIDYPIWVRFKVGETYISGNTAINIGNQFIKVNVDSNYQTPQNNNSIAREEKEYAKFSLEATRKTNHYYIKSDSLSKIYNGKLPEDIELSLYKEMRAYFKTSDSTLTEYIRANPKSYYALFRFYNALDFGLNEESNTAWQYFSKTLKNSRMGKALNQKILVAKTITVGAQIPSFNVFNSNEKKVILKDYSHNKYTLVDLWYSHCAPCIAQFDKLKSIRKEFMDKGFEIIAISTDKEKYKPDWKEVILKHELPWPQFLDLNANEAHKLNIHMYPTNFLVDQTGKILVSNISPVELKYFLKEKLK